MTNYSDIKGYRVKYLSSDPTLNTSTEGQVWYNSTSGTLKALVKTAAWSSGGNMSNARRILAGAGIQTAGFVTGGYRDSAPTGNQNATEEYNGLGWTSGGNLNTARRLLSGAGTLTAGLVFNGYTTGATNLTEEYNGTAWTAVNTVPASLYARGSGGTQTAGLGFGGIPGDVTTTSEYDGTNWAAGGALNTGAAYFASTMGTQTAGLAVGRFTPAGSPLYVLTEEYDGSTWTAGNTANTARYGGAASGIQTSALFFGGNVPPATSATEFYDGTSWTTSPASLATARHYLAGFGASGLSGLAAGGGYPVNTSATEEYDNSINTVVAGTWASGTNLPINTAGSSGGFGASYDSFAMVSPSDKNTYLYDGSTWTTGNPAGPVFSNSLAGTSAGTQTAAFMAGERRVSPEADLSTAGDWDGTSWTAANPAYSQITATGFGTQTAGGIAGGQQSGVSSQLTTTNLYDGTNWTSSGALNDGRGQMSGTHGGTQTAAVTASGEAGPPGNNKHEHFDGSTWTSQTAIPGANLRFASATGVQTSYLVYAGFSNPVPGATNTTYSWNGTAWVTEGNMATSAYNRGAPSGQTSNAKALAAGVQTAPSTVSNGVEEWTGPTTVAAASTLTTS